jgi:hypothetical protein
MGLRREETYVDGCLLGGLEEQGLVIVNRNQSDFWRI